MQSPTADLCRRSDDAGKEEFSSCSAQETGVEMTPEEAKSLSERQLTAVKCLMETFKPTTTMELIVLKATCELLIESATALLTVK